MGDRLSEYRRRRDAARTPEPVPGRRPRTGGRGQERFVIQQHHARRLHWDLRLERDGVLASWAVPRGLPRDPGRNHLAVHTEDHPLEYLDFSGEIPAGEYGGGRMTIHDRGTYACEKWRDDEVVVTLAGERTSGRYVLFATGERDWMVRRLDPAPVGWSSMPDPLRPMHPVPTTGLPDDDDRWGYELRWDGIRAIAYLSGGRIRLVAETDEEVTTAYPQLRVLAEDLAPAEMVLDGVLVDVDPAGRVHPVRLPGGGRRRARRDPDEPGVQYLIFDLLWLEGVTSLDLRYAQRRELLEGLALAGPHWQTPPYFAGGGEYALAAALEQELPGIVAKRLDSRYEPGVRSRQWLRIDAG